MAAPYVNVTLPIFEEDDRQSCAECARVIVGQPVASLNRPLKYCSMACCRRGRVRWERWCAIQGIPVRPPAAL